MTSLRCVFKQVHQNLQTFIGPDEFASVKCLTFISVAL